MKMRIWPEKTIGRWAAVLTLLFIITMAIKITSGVTDLPVRLPLPTPFLALIGIGGFVLEIIALVKDRDRALASLLSIPVGLIIIFWVTAEILFPH